MIVDRQTRRLAMLRVHRAVCAADNVTLHAEDLQREWRRIGLRRADLDAALREMAQRRLLIARQGGAHLNYELTEAGLREFRRARDAVALRFADGLTLIRARVRRLLAAWQPRPRPQQDRRLVSR